jgi:type I restriction enzyme S subunit
VEVRPGYKRTEVGVIPEDWEVKPLAKLAVILHGFGFQSQYFKPLGKYRLTTPGHFYETGGFRDVGDKQKFYDGPLPEGYLLSEGDLIVAMTEQADGLLGSAALIPIGGTYLHNQRLGKIKVLSPEVSVRFLYYVFNSKAYRVKVCETAAGTKVKHTSPSKLLEIPIALPSTKAEQRAIAEVLSDVDALIAALDRLIAKKRAIKQGAMQQLLIGQTRLPGFSEEWEVKKLGDVFDVTAGGDFDASRSSSIQDEVYRYPIYSNALSNNGLHGFCSYNDHQAGAITVTARGTLGVANFRDHDFTAIGRVLVLDPKMPVDGRFFSEFINDRIVFAVESTGVPQLTAPQISKYELSVPPLPEQRAIATVLSDMDAEITALEARREKTRALKQGMMQELLTGKTRLV